MKKLFLFLLFLSASALPGQVVEAHFAQHLVTQAMSAHPELQKMGIHVIPPGGTDDCIIACSVPSKIGKKSSPADLDVEKSGKPTVKTVNEGSFYDLALPLADAGNHPIGMIVMEMRFSGASGPEDAVQKATAIRDNMQRQIPNLQALFNAAPASDPLVLLRTTPMPGITGDFDHFAYDLAHDRLYVSAEVHHSIEVFNLKTGEHLMSAPGVTTPHTLAFVPETGQLLVADGGDNSCRILNGADLHEIKRIPLEAYPDAGYYDAQKRIFYVGNGGKRANAAYSFVSMISADEGKEIGRIRVESANLEDMALDPEHHLFYVNMRDKAQIAVIDLNKKEVRQTWSIPGLNLNTPMELDVTDQRLFVAGRKPGKLFVINTNTGQAVTTLDCVETADDMAYDPVAHRIYVTGSGGVTVVQQDSADTYRVLTQFGTNGGKTSTFAPSLKQFYIAHTKTPEDNAALQVYQVN
jgi:DNA-binding beta-propeller fold protein YncE